MLSTSLEIKACGFPVKGLNYLLVLGSFCLAHFPGREDLHSCGSTCSKPKCIRPARLRKAGASKSKGLLSCIVNGPCGSGSFSVAGCRKVPMKHSRTKLVCSATSEEINLGALPVPRSAHGP